MGHSGRVKGTRELVIVRTPYIAAYRIKGEKIQILRILQWCQAMAKSPEEVKIIFLNGPCASCSNFLPRIPPLLPIFSQNNEFSQILIR